MVNFAINNFFLFATFAIIAPYLQLFLKAKGFSIPEVGVLLGCFEIAGIFGSIIIGFLTDKLKQSRLILLTVTYITIITFISMQFFNNFWFIVVLIFIMGFNYQPLVPLLDAFTSNSLENPTKQYGQIRVFGSIGFLVILYGLQIFSVIDVTNPVTILSVFLVLTVIFSLSLLLLPKEASGSKPKQKPVRLVNPGTLFWLGIFIIFLGRIGMTAHYSFFSLYLTENFNLKNISGIWAIGATAEIPVLFFGGALIKRFGLGGMFATSLAAIIARLLVYSLCPNLTLLGVSQLLHALAFGGLHLAAIEFINRTVAQEQRTFGMAIYNSLGIGLSSFLGSFVGGFLADFAGYRSLFLLYSFPPFLGLIIAIIYYQRFQKETRFI